MRRFASIVASAVLSVPLLALAQAPPSPAAPPASDPTSPAPLPPPSGYYQPVTPVYAEAQPRALHAGFTAEVNIGAGWVRYGDGYTSITTETGVGGLSLGLGGWITPKLALTARLAGATGPIDGGNATGAFLGPSVQYWIDDDHVWVGGGAGLGVLAIRPDGIETKTIGGLSFDFRAGYTLNVGSQHTVNFSVELTPGRVKDSRFDTSLNVISLGALIGYQYL